MAFHNFEIGFDWSSSTLNIGEAEFDSVGGSPKIVTGSSFSGFTAGTDYLCFNGFNMTSGASQTGYSIIGGSVTFQIASDAPSGQTATTPLAQQSVTISPLGQAFITGPALSLVGGPFPVWAPVVPLMQVINSGSFQFTVSLIVQGPGGTQTFVVDPEMIVQATPTTPLDIQESLERSAVRR